jgi:hypothetical protein
MFEIVWALVRHYAGVREDLSDLGEVHGGKLVKLRPRGAGDDRRVRTQQLGDPWDERKFAARVYGVVRCQDLFQKR